MLKKKKQDCGLKRQGFTLIELLVAISIIGLLSSIILVSLKTTREKANQASVQANLKTISVQAELYYEEAGLKTYGAVKAPTSICTADMFTDITIKQALAAATSSGSGSVACTVGVGGQSWAMRVSYKDLSGTWCTDSTGYAGENKPYLWGGGASTAFCSELLPPPM